MTITITPKKITKENFAKFGELITTDDINLSLSMTVMQKDLTE